MKGSQFFKQYWLSFVWVGLAAYTLVVIVIGILTYSKPEKTLADIGGFLSIGVLAALVRFFVDGGRFKREILDKGATDNFILNLVIWGLQIVFLVVVWPLIEFFRQGRFLYDAYRLWKRGDILIDENGRALHAG